MCGPGTRANGKRAVDMTTGCEDPRDYEELGRQEAEREAARLLVERCREADVGPQRMPRDLAAVRAEWRAAIGRISELAEKAGGEE